MAANASYHMPWERRSEEPETDFARFQAYLGLGPERSLFRTSKECGLSLARLKQLSARWGWPARALTWDRHHFLQRRQAELRECQQMRSRLLTESADWQRMARLEFGRWVVRDAEGKLQLVRPLTAHQAIRLWQVGCQAEMELRGGLAGEETSDQRRWGDRFVAGLRQAAADAAYHIVSKGARYELRGELDDAIRRVLVAWVQQQTAHYRDADSLDLIPWPWDLPFAEA